MRIARALKGRAAKRWGVGALTLRMQPTRSGGIKLSSEIAAQSRSRFRFAAVSPGGKAASLDIAVTRAFCTSSHSIQPPMRDSYICCVLDAFSACPRRLISCERGLGSAASSASLGSKFAYT